MGTNEHTWFWVDINHSQKWTDWHLLAKGHWDFLCQTSLIEYLKKAQRKQCRVYNSTKVEATVTSHICLNTVQYIVSSICITWKRQDEMVMMKYECQYSFLFNTVLDLFISVHYKEKCEFFSRHNDLIENRDYGHKWEHGIIRIIQDVNTAAQSCSCRNIHHWDTLAWIYIFLWIIFCATVSALQKHEAWRSRWYIEVLVPTRIWSCRERWKPTDGHSKPHY